MAKYIRTIIVGGTLFLLIAFISACQPEQDVVIETVIQEVEVTRIVAESVEREGETIVVTRLVTEIIEVPVTPASPQPGEQPVTLNWNWGTEPPTVDPSLATDVVSVDIIANLFVGLTRFHPESSEVVPYLASEWEAGEDATGNQTWTFYLRDDIPWVKYDPLTGVADQEMDADGNPRFVTAHDVVYGLRRTLDPATASSYAYVLYIIKNAAAVNASEEGVSLDEVGVVALDDHTVQFTLETPAGFFPAIAGMWVAHPLPSWAIDEHEEKWTEAGLIVTNGPYVMESWIHGSQLNLLKNPLWVDADSVQIEQVHGVIVEEESTSFAMFENGELDTAFVPVAERDRVFADPLLSTQYVNRPSLSTSYYGFLNTKPPFDDVRVRRAFTQAIDRQSLIDNVLKGGQIAATSFASPGVFGAPEPGTVGLHYDPQAAKESLQEYLDEVGMTVETFNDLNITVMHPTSESLARLTEAVQQMWKDVLGVEVALENQEWMVYLDTTNKSTPVEQAPHIFWLGWRADYPDENNWVHQVFNAEAGGNRLRRNCLDPNCGSVTTSTFDDLTTQAMLSQDPQERIRLYAEAERILAEEEVAFAPLFHGTLNVITHPWLDRNYPPLSGADFYNWTIDMEEKLAAQSG